MSFDYKIYFRFGTFVLVICFFLFPCIIARAPKPEGMKKLRNIEKPSIVQLISLYCKVFLYVPFVLRGVEICIHYPDIVEYRRLNPWLTFVAAVLR